MQQVLITGTTSGIGLATTLEFARRGAHVFAGVRDMSRAGDLEKAVADEELPVTVVVGDVTDENACQAAVVRVLDEAGRLDVLINNAGRVVIAPVEETDDDEARAVFDANFFGALHMMRAALPAMRVQGSGTIVNISSIGARVSPSYYGVYAASKRALEAVSEAMQIEAQDFGVRVVLMEPGNFRTNIMRKALVARRFSDKSPYWKGLEEMRADARRVYADIEEGTVPGPEIVARAVYAAVNDEDRHFSYTVGLDAERFLEALQDAPPDEVPMFAVSDRLLGHHAGD